jgi:hypothetical protein
LAWEIPLISFSPDIFFIILLVKNKSHTLMEGVDSTLRNQEPDEKDILVFGLGLAAIASR